MRWRLGTLAGSIALAAALVSLWWFRSAGREAELAEHLRCLVVVGQVLRENDGHWPEDLVATARTLPEMLVHLDAATEIAARPVEELVTYHRPKQSDPPDQAVISAIFHDRLITITATGAMTIGSAH